MEARMSSADLVHRKRMGIAVVGFDIALDGGFELGGRVGAALDVVGLR